MKRYLRNYICRYCPTLSGQPTTVVIVVLGSAAIVGFVVLLAP